MTSQGNGQPRLYDVRLSEQIKERVKVLHAQIAARGEGKRFVAAFRQIVERLQKDPQEFGEPLFHLPALHLIVRQAVIAPLVVEYGLHEERPLVFIRDVKALS
jgi:hypothetical protein